MPDTADNDLAQRLYRQTNAVNRSNNDDELAERFKKLAGRELASRMVNNHNYLMDDNSSDANILLQNLDEDDLHSILDDISTSNDALRSMHQETLLDVGKFSGKNYNDHNEIDHLINQFTEFATLENSGTATNSDSFECDSKKTNTMLPKDWERRLAALKEFSVPKQVPLQELCEILATGPLPRDIHLDDFVDETDSWCCICNEDGHFACIECNDDVYCHRCWKETHPTKDKELRSHQQKPLRKKV